MAGAKMEKVKQKEFKAENLNKNNKKRLKWLRRIRAGFYFYKFFVGYL